MNYKIVAMSIVAVIVAGSMMAVFESSDSDADVGPVKTIYDSLTEDQKRGYDALDVAVNNSRSTGDLGYLTIADGETVRDAYAYDHPEVFWFYDCFTLYVVEKKDQVSRFRYQEVYSPHQIDDMKASISSALSSLSVDADASDYDNLRKVHDWLCDHIEYIDDTGHEGDIYGALAEGRAVCQGYTMAFTYLCHLFGFKCVGVTGMTYQSATVGHAWNLVYGEDNWFFVDVTWDDGKYRQGHDYFMVGSQTKIHGRVFATEDHFADSLYGITPSDSKFAGPAEPQTKVIILLIVVIVIAFIAYDRLYRRRIRVSVESVACAQDGGAVTGEKCPYCGGIVDSSCYFCPACGAILRDPEQEIDRQGRNRGWVDSHPGDRMYVPPSCANIPQCQHMAVLGRPL